jgi:DNA-binding response OmpR family regulator
VSSKPISVGEKIKINMATGHHATITTCMPVCSHAIEETKEKILLVDDEPDTARLFTLILENRGFDVNTFNDPLQALSNFRPNLYHLVVLDIALPSMNGFELYRKLKKIDNKVKVCFLSASDYEALTEQFPSLDTECFIPKPVKIKDLVHKITMQLGR